MEFLQRCLENCKKCSGLDIVGVKCQMSKKKKNHFLLSTPFSKTIEKPKKKRNFGSLEQSWADLKCEIMALLIKYCIVEG